MAAVLIGPTTKTTTTKCWLRHKAICLLKIRNERHVATVTTVCLILTKKSNDTSNSCSMKLSWRFDVKCTFKYRRFTIKLVFNSTTTSVYGWTVLRNWFHVYVAIRDRSAHPARQSISLLYNLNNLHVRNEVVWDSLRSQTPPLPTYSFGDLRKFVIWGSAQPIRGCRLPKGHGVIMDRRVSFW
jgi:hypothetical protein